jgi:hypothetical protein
METTRWPSSSTASLKAHTCWDSNLDDTTGRGAGGHDQPYRFGRHPRAVAPYPFSTRQFARLLVLRGKVATGLVGIDDRAA